jgi:hypothetical protein
MFGGYYGQQNGYYDNSSSTSFSYGMSNPDDSNNNQWNSNQSQKFHNGVLQSVDSLFTTMSNQDQSKFLTESQKADKKNVQQIIDNIQLGKYDLQNPGNLTKQQINDLKTVNDALTNTTTRSLYGFNGLPTNFASFDVNNLNNKNSKQNGNIGNNNFGVTSLQMPMIA